MKTIFEFTDKAGEFVGGFRRDPASSTIELTEEQAAYPLMLGEIRRPAPSPRAKSKAKAEDPAE